MYDRYYQSSSHRPSPQREGPLGAALAEVAQALHAQGYALSTISDYLYTGVCFGEWLAHHHVRVFAQAAIWVCSRDGDS